MNKITVLISCFILFLLLPLIIIAPVMAASDYFYSNDKVDVKNDVTGDAYLVGGDVMVDSNILGDLLVAGGNVTVNGKVDRDLLIAGGSVTVNSEIGGNVRVLSGDFTLNGRIGKNLSIMSGNIILSKSAVVTGNLTYLSAENASVDPEAKISGQIKKLDIPRSVKEAKIAGMNEIRPAMTAVRSAFNVFGFAFSVLAGYLLLNFFPKRMIRKTEILTQAPLRCWLTGFLILVISPVLFIFLAVTIIGIPLAISLFFIYLVSIYFAKIWVGFALGRKLALRFKQGDRRGWALVSGLFIIYLLEVMNLGFFVSLLVVPLGVGVLYLEKKELYQTLVAKKLL